MSRYLVMGGGLMGRVAAEDLAVTEPDSEVTLCDVSGPLLREAADAVGKVRVKTRRLDASDHAATVQALRDADVAVGALPHALSLGLVRAAVQAGTSLVDLVGEAPEERSAFDDEARASNCLVIPGCGVAPGISNFCVARGVELLDETRRASIYVGGIPKRKRPPLFYETVYLLESVFNAYTRDAVILQGGQEARVPPLSGLEIVPFPDPVGELEAFFTDGLASLAVTLRDKVADLFEKTLRYPGHAERIQILAECGLLSQAPVRIENVEVAPRDLLLKVLEEPLRLGPEGDILALRVLVSGIGNGEERTHAFELIDFFDSDKGHTAMARTTGYTAAIAARMIAHGEIEEKGVLFPEQIFVGARFERILEALAERGVRVTHAES